MTRFLTTPGRKFMQHFSSKTGTGGLAAGKRDVSTRELLCRDHYAITNTLTLFYKFLCRNRDAIIIVNCNFMLTLKSKKILLNNVCICEVISFSCWHG